MAAKNEVLRDRIVRGVESLRTDEEGAYEILSLFNRRCGEVRSILKLIAKQGDIERREAALYRAMIEEVRASVSQILAERFSEAEVNIAAKAGRHRKKLEQKLLGT